jgi:hypothetical protein
MYIYMYTYISLHINIYKYVHFDMYIHINIYICIYFHSIHIFFQLLFMYNYLGCNYFRAAGFQQWGILLIDTSYIYYIYKIYRYCM